MDPGTMSTENTVTSQPAIDGITTAKSYYNWTPEGKPVQVWLDFDVIDRMSAEVMRGFGSVPKRGAEVGGVPFPRSLFCSFRLGLPGKYHI